MRYDAVVAGAGICGLTAAYRLHQAGFSVCVLEQGKIIGGKIQTLETEGYTLEMGPHTFLSKGQAIMSLCRELGLKPIATAPLAKKRYLFHQDRLCPVPTNPLAFLGTPLLSLPAKLRLLQEPWIKPILTSDNDISVAVFTRQRLGEEVLERLMGPFLSGIYAGDPEMLSLSAVFPRLANLEQESGSLAKGAWRAIRHSRQRQDGKQYVPYQLLGFESGMGALPQALEKALPAGTIKLLTGLTAIRPQEGGFRLFLSTGEEIECRGLLLTTPAFVTAQLLAPVSQEAADILNQIPYVPLGVVHMGFCQSAIPHALDGFGFLIPRSAGINLLGSIWASSLFPGRAPQGHVLLTNMTGGALQPEVAEWDETRFVQQARADLARVFHVSVSQLEPVFARVVKHRQAIPQYTLGHLQRLERLETLVTQIPGLVLSGNFLRGVSLNDCVQEASRAAEKLLAQLSQVPVNQ